MADKRKKVKAQTKFCKDLMDKLVESVEENIQIDSNWIAIHNHSQISNDIIRLRRELNVLRKLMNPYN